MTTSYHVRHEFALARPVAGVRATVPRGQVATHFAAYLDRVYAAGRAGAVQLDGQNIFIYRAATADTLTVDFCVGVKSPFVDIAPVQALETPTGEVAVTTHVGPYANLPHANAAIHAWCRANDRQIAGPSWEVYGHWDPDPSKLVTDVYYLLRPLDTTTPP